MDTVAPPSGAELQFVDVAAGRVAVWHRSGGGPPILFLHGNTSSKEAFRPLFESAALAGIELVAMDLPGAGESGDTSDPQAFYTIPAMAGSVIETVAALGIAPPVFMGWSLGGHIAIEAIAQGMPVRGLVLTGTPPCGPGIAELAESFHQNEVFAVGTSETSEPEALDRYIAWVFGKDIALPQVALDQARRFDGRLRRVFAEHWISGKSGHPQRAFVAGWQGPIAVIQGDEEPFFDHTIIDRLAWGNLWRGAGQIVPKTGHAPFFEQPDAYAALLAEFAAELREGS